MLGFHSQISEKIAKILKCIEKTWLGLGEMWSGIVVGVGGDVVGNCGRGGGDVAGNCGRGRGDVVRPGGIVIRPEKNVVGPGIDPGTFRFSGGRSTD